MRLRAVTRTALAGFATGCLLIAISPVSYADTPSQPPTMGTDVAPATPRADRGSSTATNSLAPTWYDFYVVGLKTDSSDILLDPWKPTAPGNVTVADVQAAVNKVDAYFSTNTEGAVRARLAKWVPYAAFSVQDPCYRGLASLMAEARTRAEAPSSPQAVVVAATTNGCSGILGRGGGQNTWLFGSLQSQTLGHEFGHAHLSLGHLSWSDCSYVDALSPCTDYRTSSFADYWGSSIMGSSTKLNPLLPTDLAKIGLLSEQNTVTLAEPPEQPVEITINDLPLSHSLHVIQLGQGAQASYISRSGSTHVLSWPVVQVSQLPDGALGTTRSLINQMGADVPTGHPRCGTTGFCMRVLTQAAGQAKVRIWKRAATLPEPPRDVDLQIEDNGDVVLHWVAPEGGPSIEGYEVSIIGNDWARTPRIIHVDGVETSYRVTGPISASFRVATRTANGLSAFSPESAVVDTNPPAGPPGEASLHVSPGALGSATAWAECADNRYPITERRFYYTEAPGRPLDQWSTSTGAFTGLTPHREYTVKGQCRNQAGWGPLGQTTFTLQDVPRRPEMTKWDIEYGADGLRFNAGFASSNPYGDPETGVRVTLSPGGASCENTPYDLPTSCTITGLPPGQQYTASVVLTSAIGHSPSQIISVATVSLPTTPPNPTIALDAQQHAVLTWDPVQGLYGDPAVSYRVTVDDAEACTTTTTICQLPSMAAGRSYAVRVYAKTLAGESTPAMIVYAPTQTTTPPPRPNSTASTPGAGSGSIRPSPGTNITPQAQSMKALPRQIRVHKRLNLHPSTRAGSAITWSTSTKKVCRVKTYRLKARKPGSCRLTAIAPAVSGYLPLRSKVVVKVRR